MCLLSRVGFWVPKGLNGGTAGVGQASTVQATHTSFYNLLPTDLIALPDSIVENLLLTSLIDHSDSTEDNLLPKDLIDLLDIIAAEIIYY